MTTSPRNTPNRLEKGTLTPSSQEHVMKYMSPPEGPVLKTISTGMLLRWKKS